MNIPLNIDWQQILLHVLNFVILFGGLYFLLYKPVKNFMAKREAHYAEMAQKAQSELDSAEKIKADYQEQLKSVEARSAQREPKRRKSSTAAYSSSFPMPMHRRIRSSPMRRRMLPVYMIR